MNYLIPDSGYHPFSDLVKLGECTYYNSDDLLVFSCGYTGELTERSSKKKQYDLARRVLKKILKTELYLFSMTAPATFDFVYSAVLMIRARQSSPRLNVTPISSIHPGTTKRLDEE